MVECVEELAAELQPHILAEGEHLVRSEVHVHGAGTNQGVPSDVAECVVRRYAEALGLEPAIDALAPVSAGVLRRAELLRLVIAYCRQAERSVVARRDVQRETTLHGPDP